jgi:hypothetical protein
MTNRKKNVQKYNKSKKKRISNRKYELKKRFNLTLEDYDLLLSTQHNRCKICELHVSDLPNSLAVDHCHQTGKIRGLLCTNCNLGLGNFRDNKNYLAAAIAYMDDYDA